MKNFYLFKVAFLVALSVFTTNTLQAQPVAHSDVIAVNHYTKAFEAAYDNHPEIPRGILEAISYTQTRFRPITDQEPESCTGLPPVRGIMGLMPDGKGWFRHNVELVAFLGHTSAKTILNDPRAEIMAFADAYAYFMKHHNTGSKIESQVPVLIALSELPNENTGSNFALNSYLYSVLQFLNDPEKQSLYNLPQRTIQLEKVFGKENLAILSSTSVQLSKDKVTNKKGQHWTPVNAKSNDYGPAIWNPVPNCNYSSRNGTPVSAITIHTIQGSYSGAISWAMNCNSNVSYHYVIRSSDGQISQLVAEADKGWHVGSENPYTIGYEHEGYVSDPSWYTTAMYNASADLSRDVTQSGYGINPLRTYYGPASSGGNVLGNCTKIKGHHHYPNQTHTDPGINWDWERYYKLINNAPAITTESTPTGNFYDSGGPTGNYTDDERILTLIQPAGASNLTVTFTAFDLETNWDYLYIYDGTTTSDPLLGIYTGTNSPGVVTGTNGALLMEFRSDCATNNPGWAASWTSNGNNNPLDSIAPSTIISATANWNTTDFQASFTDADNTGGSGLNHSWYQVIDYNGTEWRANDDNGFFSDNFDVNVHADWTSPVGNWGINNGSLLQSDETSSNTNIYASLNQNNHDQWLYHWGGMMDGTGSNRRAGFHFMCDSGQMTNRGNSYFVWFRLDDAKIQIYETVNDVFSLEVDISYTFNAGQWYDFKTTYDKQTGIVNVYIDNSLEASWTDPSPITSGNDISLRSGNSSYAVENLKAYHSRPASVTVTVGAGATNDIRYQNVNPLTPSGKIKSIVADSADNLSGIAQEFVNVDWTAPSTISWVADGPGNDIDTTYTNTELEANWNFSIDNESDLARYWYAIGTTPGATDVVNWIDHWQNDTMVHSGLNLTFGQTYYVSVKSENGAGLESPVVSSNGVYVDLPTNAPIAGFNYNNTFICTGDSIQFYNSSINATSYDWTFQNGIPATSTDVNPMVVFPATGSYNVTLIASGPLGSDTINQVVTINMDLPPTADFLLTEDTLYLPNAIAFFTNASVNANGYAWDFGDGNSSNDTDPWNEYFSPGTYDVALTAINGNCPDDITIKTVTVLLGNTIEAEEAFGNLNIFPNPVRGENMSITLNVTQPGPTLFTIMDATGRLVWQESIDLPKGQQTIQPQFEQQPSQGFYTLQVQQHTHQITSSFLIQ